MHEVETPIAVLERLHFSDDGTFGKLSFQGRTLFTGELPWRDNLAGISCIPQGEYLCVWEWSPGKQKYTYRLKDVPNREGILIHSANFVGDRAKNRKSEVEGCIVLGLELGWHGEHIRSPEKQQKILNSAAAVRFFAATMKEQTFRLRVVNRVQLA